MASPLIINIQSAPISGRNRTGAEQSFIQLYLQYERLHFWLTLSDIMANRNLEGHDNDFKLNWSTGCHVDLKLGDSVPNTLGYGYDTGFTHNSSNTNQFSRKILPSHQKARLHTRNKLSPHSQDYIAERKLRDGANSADIDVVVDLINKGINVSATHSKGRTALHFAATHNNEFIIKVLIDHGANPNAKDVNGNTPLHLAACSNQINVVTLLLRGGTDVRAVDQSGKTPLDVALSRLRVMQDCEKALTYSKYRSEVLQIIEMLKVYSCKAGWYKEETELGQLCDRLGSATTVEQVDEVHDLLTSFTTMSLSRQAANKTKPS